MRPVPSRPQPPAREAGGRTFAESMPRQALALAVWVGAWMLGERLLRGSGLGDRQVFAAFLGILAAIGAGGILGARGWLFRLFTSVRFAVTQGVFLVGAALLGLAAGRHPPGTGPGLRSGFAGKILAAAGAGDLPRTLWFCALLAVLAAAMLTVTWKRRPYPLSRMGFLLVHTAPSLILLGALWGRLDGVRAWGSLRPGVSLDTLHRIGDPGLVRLPGFRLRQEGGEVVVLDPQDREQARKRIGPGDPLRFQGYEIHPSLLAPDDPYASAIQVVRDPGLRLVQAGFATLLLGCAWMFYLKPVLKRREARP